MEIATKETKRAVKHVRTLSQRCPECGQPLKQPISRDGAELPPLCDNTGCPAYSRNGDGSMITYYGKDATDGHNTAMERQARWSDDKSFKDGYSMYGSSELKHKDFATFKTNTKSQGDALRLARQFVTEVLHGSHGHLIIMGKAGTGKSHLANGTLTEIAKQSDFRQRVFFVNWPEFCRAKKQGMNRDATDVRKKIDRIERAWRSNALVVIDDLGAEPNTPYNNGELATALFNALEDRPCIITTNVPGPALLNRYGDRIWRRLMPTNRTVIRMDETFAPPMTAEEMDLLGFKKGTVPA
ncbi:MAG: ATP-binding protein [Lacticaseibacillus songhuajiangensis]|nr:ATP-binding protein [Lacticaseibacillus songhuajiangensis]